MLHLDHPGRIAQVGAAVERVAGAVEPGAVLPHGPLVGVVDHGARDGGPGVSGEGQEHVGAGDALHVEGGVVIHEEHVAEAGFLGLLQAAGKAACAAVVGVDEGHHPVARGDPGAVAVVDHLHADPVGIGETGEEVFQPGHRLAHLFFALEGGDRDGEARQDPLGVAGGVTGGKAPAGDPDALGVEAADLDEDQALRRAGDEFGEVDHLRAARLQRDDVAEQQLPRAFGDRLHDTQLHPAAAGELEQQGLQVAGPDPFRQAEQVEVGVQRHRAALSEPDRALALGKAGRSAGVEIERMLGADRRFGEDDVLERDHDQSLTRAKAGGPATRPGRGIRRPVPVQGCG